MKCAVCAVWSEEVYQRMLKKNPANAVNQPVPEAVASFVASNGMVVYICQNHLRANISVLDKIVIKGKFPE